jgi:putative transposase
MARPYRLQGENCLYHITSRGDDRKKIFISEHDFSKFLEYLLVAKTKYNFHLFAYCLMGNHYHLFIETLEPNLSKIMQYINTSYTVYYNTKRKKTGHVFHGRFKSIMVDADSYFLELTRYIHLNPVRAKMVEHPQDYRWSSFKGYIKPKSDKYIDYPEINRYVTMKPAAYKEFVSSPVADKKNIFDKIYAGFFLGAAPFIKDKLAELRPQVETGDFAHKRRINAAATIDDIIVKTEPIFKESRDSIIAKKHSHSNTRKVVIHLARRLTELTNKQIGGYFGIGDTAVIKADSNIVALLKEDKGLKRKVDEIFSAFRV